MCVFDIKFFGSATVITETFGSFKVPLMAILEPFSKLYELKKDGFGTHALPTQDKKLAILTCGDQKFGDSHLTSDIFVAKASRRLITCKRASLMVHSQKENCKLTSIRHIETTTIR